MISKSSGPGVPDDDSRVLGLTGSPNFRDAGGYTCQDGGFLRRGCLFRSGHLSYLTPGDRQRLESLELELVVDLRRDDERRHEPSKLPSRARLIGATITPGSQASAIYADSTRLGGAVAMFEFMREINREFVRSQSDAFRGVFAELLQDSAQRVLFHCSAGKDRTGFAVAMLQLALGVAMADVEADYLLSQRYFVPQDHLARVREKYKVYHLSDEDLMPLLGTELAYLHAALGEIDAGWDSRRAYLEEELGLGPAERQELRRRFVDESP
ncbi:MAG: tyrosine-protein phosphatase [Pseudomonadota bacterium]